ncbi:MAG: Trm112 family protein [Promethearchaeota archaeon]
MKLWLLEILACPIDKAYPLECTILNWKEKKDKSNPEKIKTDQSPITTNTNHQDPIEQLMQNYKKRQILSLNDKTPIIPEYRIEENGDSFYIKDLLIIKPTEFTDYLNALMDKIGELDVVHDKSEWHGEEALNLIRTTIKSKLDNANEKLSKIPSYEKKHESREALFRDIFKEIVPELEFLNIFKYNFEIEDAIIRCPECKRWYPVYESIPQMLPDQVRNEDSDSEFQKKWANKFDFE